MHHSYNTMQNGTLLVRTHFLTDSAGVQAPAFYWFQMR